jgi:hypothetical protein
MRARGGRAEARPLQAALQKEKADSQKWLSRYRRERACFAALWPHMPWTPAPGGVEEEQM